MNRGRHSVSFLPTITRIVSAQSISHQSSSQCHKIKLLDVPDICVSEEWSSVIEDVSSSLQRHTTNKSRVKKNALHVPPLSIVIKRLQQIPNNSDHLIKTFKHLLIDTDSSSKSIRWPGLVTLMLSKAMGNPFHADNFISKALEDVVWSSQITLAEVINLLHGNLVFRKEHWRVSSSRKINDPRKVSNEVSRLVNGYFTSSTVYKFTELKNYKVVLLMADVLESMSKTSSEKNLLDFIVMPSIKAWENSMLHPHGLLLANGCQSTLELAGYDESTQKLAHEFGRQFMLTLKANEDIQQYRHYQVSQRSSLNLSSFPVLLHLSNNPETLAFIYSREMKLDNLDFDILNSLLISKGAMDDAIEQLKNYVQNTMRILCEFQFKDNEIANHLIKLTETLNIIDRK